MSILVNRADNSRRPPDWRWQRAGEILDNGGRIVRSRDDHLVRLACKFRRLLARCQSDADMLVALDACPSLFEAYAIYDSGDVPIEQRWELEARLLANESFESIAAKTGISRETIEAYEKVFFDVLSRLRYPSVVVHTIIGPRIHLGLAERDHDVLWKLFGYFVGSNVLDACIYKFVEPAHIETADGVRAFWKDFTKDTVNAKAGIAMLTMPVNYQTREQLMILWQKLLEVEASAGKSGAGSETLVQNVNAMIESFAWTKFRPGVDADPTGPAVAIEASGVRLRATELALIGVGQTPTGLEHLLSTARFPEKKGDDDKNT